MRILYLNPSGKPGGAETSLLALLGGLRTLRPAWDLRLIAAEDGPLVDRALDLGVGAEVLPFPETLGRAGRGAGGGLTSAVWPAMRYARALRHRVRELDPGIIQTNGYKMHLLGAWCLPRKTLVCHMHDYIDSKHAAGRVMRASLGRFAAVVANSGSVARDLETGWRGGRVHSIHNGIDLSRFTPGGAGLDLDAVAGMTPAAPGTVRIGLLATFAKWKGHGTFLRAIAQLPDRERFRAYIIGGPIYRTEASQFSLEELRAEAAALGIADSVGFTGFLEDPVAAVRSLDIVAHTSTQPEPFGMVLIEAMACGKALVASNAGGAREVFEPEVTALGHAPGDAGELARQMERLVASAALREELGRSARRAVESRFSSVAMAERFAELYAGLGGRPSAGPVICAAEGPC